MRTGSCKGCEKRKTYPPQKKITANAAKNDLILTVYKSRTPRARLAYRTLETISLHHRDGSTCHSYCHSPQNATRFVLKKSTFVFSVRNIPFGRKKCKKDGERGEIFQGARGRGSYVPFYVYFSKRKKRNENKDDGGKLSGNFR